MADNLFATNSDKDSLFGTNSDTDEEPDTELKYENESNHNQNNQSNESNSNESNQSNSSESNESSENAIDLLKLDDLRVFYMGKSDKNEKTADLYDYDDEGNLIIHNKKKEIIKTIALPTYRPATTDERQKEYAEYQERIKEATIAFDEARMNLFSAYQTNHTDKEILKLNKAVQKADKHLTNIRFGEYYIDIVGASQSDVPVENRIKMKQLYFEEATEDKNVYDPIAFVQTSVLNIRNQVRIAEEAKNVVSISEAAMNDKALKKKKAEFDKLVAKSKSIYLKKNTQKGEIPTVLAIPETATRISPGGTITKFTKGVVTEVSHVRNLPLTNVAKPSFTNQAKSALASVSSAIGLPSITVNVAAPASTAPASAPVSASTAPSVAPVPNTTETSVTSVANAATSAATSAVKTVSNAATSAVAFITGADTSDTSGINSDVKKKSSTKLGNVFLGTKVRGAAWAPKPSKDIQTIDVTSGQGLASVTRRDFSPMTPIEGGYKGYWNFEHYWQAGKVYEGIPFKTSREWWKAQREPKKKYPLAKDKKLIYTCWDETCTKRYQGNAGYIQSRKDIYVPLYFELMHNRPSAIKLQEYVAEGKDIMIYDYDGPRNPDGSPATIKIDLDLLQEKINDPQFPFGHGYIVAAWLLQIRPEEYS